MGKITWDMFTVLETYLWGLEWILNYQSFVIVNYLVL